MWNSRASTGGVGVTVDESHSNLKGPGYALANPWASWKRNAGPDLVTALGMTEAQHKAIDITVDKRWTLNRRSRSAPVRRTRRHLCAKEGYLDAKSGWHAGPSKLRESLDVVVLEHQINCIAMTSGGLQRLGSEAVHWLKEGPMARPFHTPPSDSRVHGIVPAGSDMVF